MLIPTKEFQITAAALMFDPDCFIFDFNPDKQTTKFLLVEEQYLDLAPFVDIRFEPLAKGHFSVSTSELFKLESMHNMPRQQAAFIFHHAFVCSTLLARCLNQIDAFFSLKEPWIIRRLSDFKRTQRNTITDAKWRQMLVNNINLLSKNYHGGKTPVIKATNTANNLIIDVLKYLPGQKILYLYSDLESFLISNLKKPKDTQIKMPALATGFLADGDFRRRFPQYSDVDKLSFLQVCALIWLVSLYNFKCSTEKFDSSNVRTLEMNKFLADMPGTLNSLSSFYQHQATALEIEAMLDPKITQTDAKHQNLLYGKDKKQAESTQVLKQYSTEINKTVHWLRPLAEDLKVLEYCCSRQLGA